MRKAPAKSVVPFPGCEACAAEFDLILKGSTLQPRFRPVANFQCCDMFGYIATVRGSAGTLHGSFDRLARISRQIGRLHDFSLAVTEVAVRRFIENAASGVLFLPVPVGAVEESGRALARDLSASVAANACAPERIVVMMSGLESADVGKAVEFSAAAHSAGLRLASRSFGCGLAEQRLWSQVAADFLLLDEHLFEDTDLATTRNTAVFARLADEMAKGRIVVADGIKSSNDFRSLQLIGVRYGAGDFIGRANVAPTRALSAAAHKAIAAACDCHAGGPAAPGGILQRLLTKTAPVSPECNSEDVFALFERNPDLRAVAVVENGIPCGLISRYEMVDNMARPFRHELYGRKPCTRFMDAQPLVVDIGVSLEELAAVVVGADPRHLISGFIITEHGNYLGMGSVQDLVREVTSMQMDAAKYANPLTLLPGNVPINQHIDNLLAAGEPFCIAYCDLDHFKPFNDVYGYAKGDEVIQLTARTLAAVADAERDFVGHIGGDDFVMVLRSEDWEARCNAALARFSTEILDFFSYDDVERGGYVTENRKGLMEFHRLTSLSIGAVVALPGMFQNHLQVSTIAAEVKKRAKAIPGNSLFINQRQYSDEKAAQPDGSACERQKDTSGQ